MAASRHLLVTGAAGFIGSHVVRDLLRLPEFDQRPILAVDDLSGGFEANLPNDPRVTFLKGDVTDAGFVDELFAGYSVQYIWHLAAYAAEGLSHFIRTFNYRNNLLGSMNLLNNAVRCRCERFVFTSSIAVYGAAQVPMSESTVPCPEDPYGIAKYAVELDLKAAWEMFGIPYTIFRPHNVYGEFQNIGDRYRNVVGIFMNQILRGEPMTIFGDGRQQRAFSYIGDVSPQIARAPLVAAAKNAVFNIGADLPVSVNELAAAVAEAMGVPGHPVRHVEARNEVQTAFSDHTACRTVFGENARTSLSTGLQKTAVWVRKEGARSTIPFREIELDRNLPPVWLED